MLSFGKSTAERTSKRSRCSRWRWAQETRHLQVRRVRTGHIRVLVQCMLCLRKRNSNGHALLFWMVLEWASKASAGCWGRDVVDVTHWQARNTLSPHGGGVYFLPQLLFVRSFRWSAVPNFASLLLDVWVVPRILLFSAALDKQFCRWVFL